LLERRLIPDYSGLVERSLRDMLWGRYESGKLVSVGSRFEEPVVV
jgi:hypothetical protein